MNTFLFRTRKGLAVFGLSLLLFVVAVLPVAVEAAKGDLVDVDLAVRAETPAPLEINLGKAEVIGVDGDVADILVADPSVIDVVAVQSDKLYIVGSRVGDTNLIALNEYGDVVKKMDVHVTYDLQAIQSTVDRLFAGERVTVGSIHDRIFLTGTVSTPENASKIANMVSSYAANLMETSGDVDALVSNLLEVRGEQQVMLQVKIIEATRSALKELGVESNANDPLETATTTIFGATPGTSQFGTASVTDPAELAFGTGGAIALSQDPAGIGRFLFNSGIKGLGTIGLFLNALEDENLVNILAEPNLTAVSGQEAGFLAGGEFPVPVGRDQVGNLVIEFREFGVSLNFRPMVMSDERISLQLNTEVSSLDFDNAIELADTQVPGLDVRRAETTVELGSGASLMIAGLLRSETVSGMSGLPGVLDTPVIGDLVKSDSFRRDETELLVIVTPYLVEPYKDDDRSEPIPRQKNNPLAKVFVTNVRQRYELDEEQDIFANDYLYGYLLD